MTSCQMYPILEMHYIYQDIFGLCFIITKGASKYQWPYQEKFRLRHIMKPPAVPITTDYWTISRYILNSPS